jgi:acyl-CoA dehydrogenase
MVSRRGKSERLSIAVNSQAAAASALQHTVEIVTLRPDPADQFTKFELAACATEVQAGQVMTDQALEAHDAGQLSPVDAAALKLYGGSSEIMKVIVAKDPRPLSHVAAAGPSWGGRKCH